MPVSSEIFGGLAITEMKSVLQNKSKYLGTQNFDVTTQDKKNLKLIINIGT